MDRREFLRNGAMALASLVVPQSKAVKESALEETVKDRDFWMEQSDFWESESAWWKDYALQYAKALNGICRAFGIPQETPDEEIVERAKGVVDSRDFYKSLFDDVVYPVAWDLICAGYLTFGDSGWIDSVDGVKRLIADKEALEKDVDKDFKAIAEYWEGCSSWWGEGYALADDENGKLKKENRQLKEEVARLKKKVNGILAFKGHESNFYYVEHEYWDDDGNHHVGYVLAEEEIEERSSETSKHTFNTTVVHPVNRGEEDA